MDLISFYRKLTNQFNIGIWYNNNWVYEVNGLITECGDDEDEIGALTEALRKYESNNNEVVKKCFDEALACQLNGEYDAALIKYLYIVEMINGYYQFSEDDDYLTEVLFAITDCYIEKDDFKSALEYIVEAEKFHDKYMIRCKHFEKAKLFLNFAIRELNKCDNSDGKFIAEDFELVNKTVGIIEDLVSSDVYSIYKNI